jgi:ribulose-phosphate 3-epimerase
MRKIIVPSVIAETQEELDKRIQTVGQYASILQLDFFDGSFVPTRSFEYEFKLPRTYRYEADLLIRNPEKWIEEKGDLFETILVHWVAVSNPQALIHLAKNRGKKFGFALDVNDPLEWIKPYLDKIDQLLVMTGKAGYYGSPFQPQLLEKVREARRIMPRLDIEVDVGINDRTIKMASDAGANIFVSGSYISKDDNVKGAIERLLKIAEGR